jgi:predicted NBD/HSP70 family sugar kinase
LPDRLSDIFDGRGRGVQHHGLRRTNERAVLSVIAFNAGSSNAEISRLAGLAPQTVSAILSDLEAAKLIVRGEALRGKRGQPATPIHTNPDGAFTIGCEIGWRHADLILLDLHAQVRARHHLDYAFPDARTLPGVLATVATAMIEGLDASLRQRVIGMGVAMPTGLGHHIHLIDPPPDQPALWAGLDLEADLSRQTGVPVSILNDGNAACWAELVSLPQPRPSDFIYLHVSAFVSAGIVAHSQLWEGSTGNAANLGSMLVDTPDGMEVAHFVASVEALRERLRRAGRPIPTGHAADWDWHSLGDVGMEWIEAAGGAFARIIFNTMAVIDTRTVIIDGILPRPVMGQLVDAVQRHSVAMPIAGVARPAITVGSHGGLAPTIGAAELPLYRRYFARDIDIVSQS